MNLDLVLSGAALWQPEIGGPSEEPEIPAGIDPRTVRRSTRLGRIALAVASEALTRAALDPAPEDTALVVGTALADLDETAGFLGGIHARGARFASPQFFQRSVHGAVAGELAILLALRGYNLTVSEGMRSGEAALAAAILAVQAGRAPRALVVAIDGRSEALSAALNALGLPDEAGEGAAALVVETAADAARRGAPVLAALGGVNPSMAPGFSSGRHGASGLCDVARYALGESPAAPASVALTVSPKKS
ncbi:MAG: beta-ketoacyl synthase N-terminal-like domain-containing protein [Myxococcota bacterium]